MRLETLRPPCTPEHITSVVSGFYKAPAAKAATAMEEWIEEEQEELDELGDIDGDSTPWEDEEDD